jgi:hypothetical protein
MAPSAKPDINITRISGRFSFKALANSGPDTSGIITSDSSK